MKQIHAACGQFETNPGNTESNVATMITLAQEAVSVGCELILFPELNITGYIAADSIPGVSEPLDGKSVEQLRNAAHRLGIAIATGMAERDPSSGLLHNSLVIIDHCGSVVGVYRKIQLWDSEATWAAPGDSVPVFRLGDITVGGWICYDSRFPEVARTAALSGAEICLAPAAWLGPGDEWELALRSRALDNGIFVLGADTINYDPALRCRGLSLICGPRGNVLARAEAEQPGIIHAVLDPHEMDAQRGRVPLLSDRRPDVYQICS